MDDILYVKINELEKAKQISMEIEENTKKVFDSIRRDLTINTAISNYLMPTLDDLRKIRNINNSKDTQNKYSNYIENCLKIYKVANEDVKKCYGELLKLSIASANIKVNGKYGVVELQLKSVLKEKNTNEENTYNIIKNNKGKVQDVPYDIKKRMKTSGGREYSLYNQLMEGYRDLENAWTGNGICVPSSIATLLSGFNIYESQINVIQNLGKLENNKDKRFHKAYEGNKFLGLCYYNLHVEGYNIEDCTDRKKHMDKIWEHLQKGYPVAVSKKDWHNVEQDNGNIVQNQTGYHAIVFIDYRIKKDGTKQVRISDSWDINGIDNDAWVDFEYFVNHNLYSYMLVDEDIEKDSKYYMDGYYNEKGEYVRNIVTVHVGDYGESVKDKFEYELIVSTPNY